MKKFIYAISVLALMCVAGCTKEESQTPTPEYKLVVNMEKSSFGDDTRAPRNSWEDGDIVIVVFEDLLTSDDTVQTLKYLKLTYQFSTNSWISEWIATSAEEVINLSGGKCGAIYNSIGADVSFSAPNFKVSSPYWQDSKHKYYLLGGCVMTCIDGTYTVEKNTITLNITMKPRVAQYTVRNISTADDVIWKMKITGLLVKIST